MIEMLNNVGFMDLLDGRELEEVYQGPILMF